MIRPTYQQLAQLYEDSLDTICSQQMEIIELKQERVIVEDKIFLSRLY